jgi:hypothetical protein
MGNPADHVSSRHNPGRSSNSLNGLNELTTNLKRGLTSGADPTAEHYAGEGVRVCGRGGGRAQVDVGVGAGVAGGV